MGCRDTALTRSFVVAVWHAHALFVHADAALDGEADVDSEEERQRRLLREMVVAGPGGALGGGAGLLTQVVPADAIADAVHRSGHVDQRRRTLTGEVIAATLLNLAMYSDEGYDSVVARTLARRGLPGPRPPGEKTPTGSALSQARTGFPAEVMRLLFDTLARLDGPTFPQVKGASLFGLAVTAFDGTTLDLSHQGTVEQEFAIPDGGRYPQARVVTLAYCATRRLLAAAVDSYQVAECGCTRPRPRLCTARTVTGVWLMSRRRSRSWGIPSGPGKHRTGMGRACSRRSSRRSVRTPAGRWAK
ncbi:transposase domain-containing protein [Sphaerimonospora cavernae]|uniref:Transposase domain-containing protein n=1 Tax=Sphaerimonospora cavernae TaxID=1740611 RepID=A0ABV6U397_9ACTN